VAPGFFPLDDELALLPGTLTLRLQESLVRLVTHIPSFAKASQEVAWLTGAHVHPDTARRHTEAAGAVLVAHETAEAARILREHPAPPCAPDTLLFSVNGAMIPLVHGQWTEVRTLAVGEVRQPRRPPPGRLSARPSGPPSHGASTAAPLATWRRLNCIGAASKAPAGLGSWSMARTGARRLSTISILTPCGFSISRTLRNM
jgi:hypothetical protein